MSQCCITGFKWDGKPSGSDNALKVGGKETYVTGSNKDVAILVSSIETIKVPTFDFLL